MAFAIKSNMNSEMIIDIILDALKDSLIVFLIVFILHILLSLFEVNIADKLKHNSKLSSLLGSLFGLVPECGFSIIGSDLYIKEHITMGTLVAIFLSCSDEAIPLMLAAHNEKTLWVFALLISKFIIGFIVGFLVDLIYRRKMEILHHLHDCHHEDEVHVGCCNHKIDDHAESKLDKFLWHPLKHSLKIFLYVLAINLIFGFIIGFVGEENISSFIEANKYLSPLFACLVGLIPNCASSVIITELFIMGNISFGACLGGLLVNSGLGIIYLIKNNKKKTTIPIILICFLTALAFGYIVFFIGLRFGF